MNEIVALKNRLNNLYWLANNNRQEIFTPIELVREMLDKLPVEVWKNPNLKWLNPASKNGVFSGEIILRLFDGLSGVISDEEKRYNHIINNMVYAYAYSKLGAWTSRKTLYGNKTVEGNVQLVEVWKEETNMKFDLIIGNPPFGTDGKRHLYKDFFVKSFEIIKNNGWLVFITPSRYTIQPEFESMRNYIEYNSKSVYLKNVGRVFGNIASFDSTVTVINFDFNSGIKNINWYGGIGNSITQKILMTDTKRINSERSKGIKNVNRNDYPEYKTDKYIYKYFANNKGKEKKIPFRYLDVFEEESFKPKVVVTEFVGTGMYKTLGKIYVDYFGDWGLCTDSSMVIYENSKEKLEKLEFYLGSSLMDYIITKLCQSSHVNQTMKLLPDIINKLGKDKRYWLREMYNIFNLTDDEIKLIEENV